MAEVQVGTPAHGTPAHGAPRHRVRGAADALLGPLWRTTFRDPVRQGRLRLDGLSAPERQLARVGLVLLVVLLASLLAVDVWRRGELLFLDLSAGPRFVPEALVPVTLVGFFVAMLMLVWGAMDASPLVRVLVAAAYVGTVSALGTPSGFGVDTWVLRHGETVIRVAFFVPVGALLGSAVLARWRRVERWATPVLRLLTLLGMGTLLGTLLWLNHDFRELGYTSTLPLLINSGFTIIDGMLVPLVILAGVAVVDFATDVSTSLSDPAARARVRWRWTVALVVVAVSALKLWLQVGRELDYWRAYVERQPVVLVRTVVAVALLALLCVVVHRLAGPSTDEGVDEAKERLTLAGAVVISVIQVVAVLLIGIASLWASLTTSARGVELAQEFPTVTLSTWVPLVASFLAVALGVRLLQLARAGRVGATTRELATGLVVVGAWNAPIWVLTAADVSLGFSYRAVDVLVTVAALVWLAVRARRATVPQVAVVLALVLFSWLVMSRGDYISFAGGLLGLPALVVVVFGILYTLASGASFTTESSRRLPRESRTLMFTGYVLLSVTILHWLEAVHEQPLDASASGFYYLGIPLAAWLVVRRLVPRGLDGSGGAGSAPDQDDPLDDPHREGRHRDVDVVQTGPGPQVEGSLVDR